MDYNRYLDEALQSPMEGLSSLPRSERIPLPRYHHRVVGQQTQKHQESEVSEPLVNPFERVARQREEEMFDRILESIRERQRRRGVPGSNSTKLWPEVLWEVKPQPNESIMEGTGCSRPNVTNLSQPRVQKTGQPYTSSSISSVCNTVSPAILVVDPPHLEGQLTESDDTWSITGFDEEGEGENNHKAEASSNLLQFNNERMNNLSGTIVHNSNNPDSDDTSDELEEIFDLEL